MSAAQIENVANWLKNGCDVSHAVTELRSIADKMRASPPADGEKRT